MPQTKKFIIDFDSTFTQVEALDILGEISLINDPEKVKKNSNPLRTSRTKEWRDPSRFVKVWN